MKSHQQRAIDIARKHELLHLMEVAKAQKDMAAYSAYFWEHAEVHERLVRDAIQNQLRW